MTPEPATVLHWKSLPLFSEWVDQADYLIAYRSDDDTSWCYDVLRVNRRAGRKRPYNGRGEDSPPNAKIRWVAELDPSINRVETIESQLQVNHELPRSTLEWMKPAPLSEWPDDTEYLAVFYGDDFHRLRYSVVYVNTPLLREVSSILGVEEADSADAWKTGEEATEVFMFSDLHTDCGDFPGFDDLLLIARLGTDRKETPSHEY